MQLRPMPKIDADSAPFWAGTAESELRIQRCRQCQQPRFYPRLLCPKCWSDDSEWVVTSGLGTIYSYSVVHRSPWRALAEEVPYVVALVDLDDGVRMFTTITDSPDLVKIDSRVRVSYREVSPDLFLPVFSLMSDA
jgi:uncharacterized OB-fold protein